MSEFFNMGGYAAYIWPAYGISAVVLIGLTWASLAAYRKASAEVASLEAGAPVYSKKAGAGPDMDQSGGAPAHDAGP